MRNEERGTWNVIYFELLKPGETVNIEPYRQQMIDLNQALREKRPEYQKRQHKVILLHDNAPSHTAKPVKETIEAFSWEILSHAAYSPDLAPSDYYLFASMGHAMGHKRVFSILKFRFHIYIPGKQTLGGSIRSSHKFVPTFVYTFHVSIYKHTAIRDQCT